ncbi:hypothetical protein RO3G_06831 [Rhizopus delemar RA 99-880]|uniref:Uncharacterized protein n=1 Tax=Rhizopus delemar (strain RA 99-880 / ATCC MYA-4621 / FGSC 9543 / NRRL 43880) TaxID=246409 RepID=I1C0Z6_RHIO9|nr:hypothetical protein RO3G_06831 [Rhizopus delemar RA 99-880]|eukprot:EIE82126.1 hypothetical protein RO3G_06831 [Rhizopus delemar RA 99-880]
MIIASLHGTAIVFLILEDGSITWVKFFSELYLNFYRCSVNSDLWISVIRLLFISSLWRRLRNCPIDTLNLVEILFDSVQTISVSPRKNWFNL